MTHNFMDGGVTSFAHFMHYIDESYAVSFNEASGIFEFVTDNGFEIVKIHKALEQD